MNKIVNNSILAFIGKLAIICNFFTFLSLLIMFVKWVHFPGIVASYIIGLGIVMGPIVNISFLIYWLIFILLKQEIIIPKWQTIFIIFMLIVQILTAFV
jgi:hypothetical protein